MQKPIEDLIQNLQKQKKKILSLDELKNLIYKSFWENVTIGKIYKITFQLKNRWFLFPIRKDIFYIADPMITTLPEEIEEKRYRKLLRDHCNETSKQRYISWLTALEIHLHWNGVTIPENIIITNKDKQANEILLFEKNISFKKYETKWKNLITSLMKQTMNVTIQNCKNIYFLFLGSELTPSEQDKEWNFSFFFTNDNDPVFIVSVPTISLYFFISPWTASKTHANFSR